MYRRQYIALASRSIDKRMPRRNKRRETPKCQSYCCRSHPPLHVYVRQPACNPPACRVARDDLPHARAGEHIHTHTQPTARVSSVHERKEEQPFADDPEDKGREDPRSRRRGRHGEESFRDDKARGRGHRQYGESAEAHADAAAERPPLPSAVPAVELA